MLSFMIFCHVWSLHVSLTDSDENSTGVAAETFWSAVRLSVPEEHHLCLPCAVAFGSAAVWTRQDGGCLETLSSRGGRQRHRVLPDGLLCLLQLDDSDGGEYRCNGRLVAELQVLTGHDLLVSAGWTLLLPCRLPYKPKQRWFHRRRGGRREPIFTRYRNGTMRPERQNGRLSYGSDALQIHNLQPEDAGEYECGELQVRVTVVTVAPVPTSVSSPSGTTASAAAMADVVEIKETKRLENALLLAAAVGLGIMILLLAAVCVLLTSIRCRRRNTGRFTAQGHRDTELQPWTTASRQTEYEVFESMSLPEETIHYASLGRQNWGERPGWTPPGRDHRGVIYSSVRPGCD